MCESCTYRPEMNHCSQCRTPLYAHDGTVKLTRNRALEDLARNTFPPVERESTGGRSRGLENRGVRGRERGVVTLATSRPRLDLPLNPNMYRYQYFNNIPPELFADALVKLETVDSYHIYGTWVCRRKYFRC